MLKAGKLLNHISVRCQIKHSASKWKPIKSFYLSYLLIIKLLIKYGVSEVCSWKFFILFACIPIQQNNQIIRNPQLGFRRVSHIIFQGCCVLWSITLYCTCPLGHPHHLPFSGFQSANTRSYRIFYSHTRLVSCCSPRKIKPFNVLWILKM